MSKLFGRNSSRVFYRDGKLETRTFCPCELCRLRFGRLFMKWREYPGRWRRHRSLNNLGAK
jgi:hypothetical protein